MATSAKQKRLADADVDELVRDYGADPARIALAGYSMGGDLAWAVAQRDPERYAGAIVMGSRASHRAKGALEKLAGRGARFSMFMGESEKAARMTGIDAARAALDRAGAVHGDAEASVNRDAADIAGIDQGGINNERMVAVVGGDGKAHGALIENGHA